MEAEPSAVQQETITEPAKLLRIASMVRELFEETRQASLDESGRKRLADVYQRSVQELGGVDLPGSAGGAHGARPARRLGAERIGDPDRPGPAGRLAGGPVPRYPGRDVRAAGGGPGAVRGAPPTRSARWPGAPVGRRPAAERRPVPLGHRGVERFGLRSGVCRTWLSSAARGSRVSDRLALRDQVRDVSSGQPVGLFVVPVVPVVGDAGGTGELT